MDEFIRMHEELSAARGRPALSANARRCIANFAETGNVAHLGQTTFRHIVSFLRREPVDARRLRVAAADAGVNVAELEKARSDGVAPKAFAKTVIESADLSLKELLVRCVEGDDTEVLQNYCFERALDALTRQKCDAVGDEVLEALHLTREQFVGLAKSGAPWGATDLAAHILEQMEEAG